MKEDPNAFRNWLTTLIAAFSILASLFGGWLNLSNKIAVAQNELGFVSSQLVLLRVSLELHTALPAHPVAEERTKQLIKEMSDVLDRLARVENRKP